MKEGSRANALLVELLLVIFFFMIGSTILVQLFADARHKSIQAKAASESLAEGQNCAEAIYAAEDPEAWMAEHGFVRNDDGGWFLEREEYTLYVTAEEPEETAAGLIRTFIVSAKGDGAELYTLSSTRYLPKGGDAP